MILIICTRGDYIGMIAFGGKCTFIDVLGTLCTNGTSSDTLKTLSLCKEKRVSKFGIKHDAYEAHRHSLTLECRFLPCPSV
jgi:hypothetical protein